MRNLLKIILSFVLVFCLIGFVFAQSQDNSDSTKIKIIRIPRPAYTPEAKKQGITGDVVLKVEFKADSEIGEVIEVAEKNDEIMRKYGLIDQAIKAAKGIKFFPAIENGTNVTQTKIVIIQFRML